MVQLSQTTEATRSPKKGKIKKTTYRPRQNTGWNLATTNEAVVNGLAITEDRNGKIPQKAKHWLQNWNLAISKMQKTV